MIKGPLVIPFVLTLLGARGAGCDNCPAEGVVRYTKTVPQLPPGNGPDASLAFTPGARTLDECKLTCGDNVESCSAVLLDGGVPAIVCNVADKCHF